jgi:hypothetical protein
MSKINAWYALIYKSTKLQSKNPHANYGMMEPNRRQSRHACQDTFQSTESKIKEVLSID